MNASPAEILAAALDRGLYTAQNVSSRDGWIPVYRQLVGRKPATKAEIDAFVAPLVDAGLVTIRKSEQLIKGGPGGGSRPATAVWTSYVVADSARDAWCRANPARLTAWQRQVLGLAS